jgi:hypothetical protein
VPKRNADDLHFAVMPASLAVARRDPTFNDHPELAARASPLNPVANLEHETHTFLASLSTESGSVSFAYLDRIGNGINCEGGDEVREPSSFGGSQISRKR